MSAETNAGFLTGLTNWIKERNAAEREMIVRDAAINRGPSGGKLDASGLPDLNLAEQVAGLTGFEGQQTVQRQSSANNIGSEVNESFKEDPTLYSGVDRSRRAGEDDFDYNSRIQGTQQSVSAVQGALDEGVPSSLLQSDTQLKPSQVRTITDKYNTNQGFITNIRDEIKGPELLALAREKNDGKPLTTQQLTSVLQQARLEDPGTQSDLATADQSRRSSQSTITVNEGNLALNRTQQINNQRIKEAEIAFNNEKLKRDYEIAQIQRSDRIREAQLDRGLRKDLAVLGLEDKRDSRDYERSRDERRDRQLMIMQLIKGLSSMGQSIAI